MTGPDARLQDLVAAHAPLGDVQAVLQASGPSGDVPGIAATLAFPFLSYLQAVGRYCRAHDIRQVYFLAREGLFFQRLFAVVAPADVQTHYLCVSRIALLMLTLRQLDEASVDRVLDLFENHSHLQDVCLQQLLYLLKIDDPQTLRRVRALGHDPRRCVPFKEHRDRFRTVLLDEEIQRAFAWKRSGYLEQFLAYLRSVGVLQADRILLVDMGWSGSMQTYLTGILAEAGYAVEIHGFYFGYDQTIDAQKHALSSSQGFKTGYFVNDGTPSRQREQEVINNLFLEAMASAGHGTVVSYRERRGQVRPVLKHIPEEIWQHWRVIGPFQRQILAHAARHRELFDLLARTYPEAEVHAFSLTSLHQLFHEPSPAFKRFLAFIFYDDFFGRDVRMLLAPYRQAGWGLRLRFGSRGIACRLARVLVPATCWDWLVADEIRAGDRTARSARAE